jgi:molybdopterin-containing oxidoreductase family iron-sulfur binding subunit
MEDYLKERWSEIYARGANIEGDTFESFWTTVLQAGVWGEKTRKASNNFVPDKRVIEKIAVAAPEFAGDSDAYPFLLHPYVSNSLRDGRGANLPWLQELPDPMTGVVYGSWVELHPSTANKLGLDEGDLVEVESPQGKIAAPVLIYPAIRPDVIAMPIGQGHAEYGRYARNRGANPMQILAPVMDSETGSLASSATRVKLRATGRRAQLVKSGGESRELGRDIVQTTGSSANHGDNSAALHSIPITVETS